MNESQSLAINEFSFRYLYPLRGKEDATRPLNRREKRSQFFSGKSVHRQDVSHIVLAALLNTPCPANDKLTQLIYAISRTHLPNYITPDSQYGRHCDYPSPRSYYPLKIIIFRKNGKEGKYFHLDLETWSLNEVNQPEGTQENTLEDNDFIVQTDFSIYNKLYNRFRYGLFALETGHFQRALSRHLRGLGNHLTLSYSGSQFIGRIGDSSQPNATTLNLSKRTAGFFHYGLFPERIPDEVLDFKRISTAYHRLKADYLKHHPDAIKSGIELKVVVDNTQAIAPGLYSVTKDGLMLAKEGHFMSIVQDAYNYQNFSFTFSSCVFFFTVKETAFETNDSCVKTNQSLGYLSQCLIEYFTEAELFARPFRSYDQLTIDTFLSEAFPDCTAYYGLLIGKNRAAQSLGAIQ